MMISFVCLHWHLRRFVLPVLPSLFLSTPFQWCKWENGSIMQQAAPRGGLFFSLYWCVQNTLRPWINQPCCWLCVVFLLWVLCVIQCTFLTYWCTWWFSGLEDIWSCLATGPSGYCCNHKLYLSPVTCHHSCLLLSKLDLICRGSSPIQSGPSTSTCNWHTELAWNMTEPTSACRVHYLPVTRCHRRCPIVEENRRLSCYLCGRAIVNVSQQIPPD